jgi:hypothetical protein
MLLTEFSLNNSFQLRVDFAVTRNILSIEYRVSGPLQSLALGPVKNGSLQRANELWKRSCFECFFFAENSSYIELNFNNESEYDFLFFSDYRRSTTTKFAIKALSILSAASADFLSSKIQVEFPQRSSFTCVPAAILIPQGQNPLFYATKHAVTPDFHRRQVTESKGFQLQT